MGIPDLLMNAQNNVKEYQDLLNRGSQEFSNFLKKFIEQGHDFLLVKSAGNESNEDKIYDPQYDFLGAIKDPVVKQHILIVAAAENIYGEFYEIAEFSNRGDRVDLYAPGVDVLSTVPDNQMDSYGGTSMAAPIVSGLAALIWGVNPELSAVDVANIIRKSQEPSMIELYKTTYWAGHLMNNPVPIVNAAYCVELAQETAASGANEIRDEMYVQGSVYFLDEHTLVPVVPMKWSIVDESGETVVDLPLDQTENFRQPDETEVPLNTFDCFLAPGTYTLLVEAEGYNKKSVTFPVESGKAVYLPVEMEKTLLVSDAYAKECTYTLRDNTKCTSVYRIPKIDSNSDKIKKINDEIYNTLYPKIETCVSEIVEVGQPLSGRNITYQWAVNGDVLSIVVQQSEKVPHGGTDYYVYNISVSDNETVSREKIFATAGLSSDAFYDVVKSAIEKAYPQIFGPDTGSIVIDEVSILEQSVAHENIDLSQPYINNKGNLHVIVPLYCPAGPTYLYYDIQCTGDEEAEKTTENTEAPEISATEPTETEAPQTSPTTNSGVLQADTTIYAPVLNLYYHGISNHWQDDISEGWNEIVNWAQPGVGEHGGCAMIERSFHTDSALSEIGYLLVDLNQDGQDELIISPLEDGKNGMVYDLYTVSDGKIVRLIVSDERSRAYLTAGNTITMEASGGWNVSISKIYYLKGADLCIRESLRYDGVEDESNPWFYAKADGTITKDQSEKLTYEHISEEEFNTKMNQLPSKVSLTLTPFEQYQPS